MAHSSITTLHLQIDRNSGTPLHLQVYEGIRRAILDRRLRPGERIPSTRALAADLGISRLPVVTAYEQLLHEGYAHGRWGSGTYVSRALPDDFLESRAPPSGGRRVPHRGAQGGRLLPFRINLPALDQFPHRIWARLVSRHAHAMTPSQMAYGDPAGLAELRSAIAEHLRSARAVRCEADQVIIVSGSQAALRIAAAVLVKPGDRVAMEEPGYPGARQALAAGGARLVPVPLDREGMSAAALDTVKGRVPVVYVTPAHQYPLGISMSAGRRLTLLDWALRRRAWVLEDDYDSEFRYTSRPLGALQGMDAAERVIYIGTFSKVLFPSLRVGYLVVPPALRRQFIEARAAFDLCSPTLYQLVLAEFLREGHFARHLRRMRGIYLRRSEALLDGLMQHCADGLRVRNSDAGLHLTASLPAGVQDVAVVRRMSERGLMATALSSCYAGRDRRNGLLLGFGGFPEPQLHEATRVLGEVLASVRGPMKT